MICLFFSTYAFNLASSPSKCNGFVFDFSAYARNFLCESAKKSFTKSPLSPCAAAAAKQRGEAEEEDAEFISAIHRGEFGGLDSDYDAYGYDAYGQTFDHPELDGLDDGLDGHYYGEVQPTRRASLNGLLGLPDEQDAEFLERADYEKDSLSGDSHEDCELYGALH